MKKRAAVCAGAAVVVGCFSDAKSLDNLRARSAFDLSCPKDQLAITPIVQGGGQTTTAGVSGCGKRAVYVLSPNAVDWVANNPAVSSSDTK